MRRESERIGYGIEFEMIYRALVSNCFDRKWLNKKEMDREKEKKRKETKMKIRFFGSMT